MFLFSIRFRNRLSEIGLAVSFIVFIWLLQTNIVTRLTLSGLLCNLPLISTIIWGAIFSSHFKPLSQEEVKKQTFSEIIAYQALSGSSSGCLVGAFVAALYASILPIYPFCYPIIGWIAGYFPINKMNQAALLSIPLVFFATVLAEFIMTIQLMLSARPEAFSHFVDIALPESALNALMAPLILLPVKQWYQYWIAQEGASE